MFKGINTYYDQLNEDVFISYNQDLFDETKCRVSEKDALVVNLSKGYVLIVEAKNYLTQEVYYSNGISSLTKGLQQLKNTMESFSQIGSRLTCDWKVIRILYGSSVDTKVNLCSRCRQFVISKKDGPFNEVLTKLMSQMNLTPTSWSFAKDFYNLVKYGKTCRL